MSSPPKLHQIDHIEGNGKEVKIITSTAARWEQVATRLHFDRHIIEHITRDHHYQTVPCCRKIFEKWLDGAGRQPANWKTLIITLKEANFSELAEEVQEIIDQ